MNLARRSAVSASEKNLTQRRRRVISISTWHWDLISLFFSISYRENYYQQPRSCFSPSKADKASNEFLKSQICVSNSSMHKELCLIFSPASLKFRLGFYRALHKVRINQKHIFCCFVKDYVNRGSSRECSYIIDYRFQRIAQQLQLIW